MSRITKEASMLEPVANYIRRKGYRFQEPELAFYEYRVDLYGFSRVENRTVAVELKLHDWRRAFRQAILYQLCADEVYIAMPRQVVARVDSGLLREHGIGLIAVTERRSCQKVLDAAQSAVVQATYRDDYIRFLEGRRQWQL